MANLESESSYDRNEDPTTLSKLLACLIFIACFKHQSYYQFCEMVERVKYHHELARLFVLHLHNDQVNLVGVTFILTPKSIAEATGIPNVGEKWNKRQLVDREHYEPYIKAGFQRKISRVFPFRYLQDTYAPFMKLIIKYFSCEGRFSHLYAYQIRLLIYFTRVRMINLPYFICRNIEKMTTLVQRKPPHQQYNNIYHFALIKIVVLHQLSLLNVSWEDFISHEVPTGSLAPPPVFHEAGEPSHQQEVHEPQTTSVLVFVTYQKGTRILFAIAKRVLSPPRVEGVLFPSIEK